MDVASTGGAELVDFWVVKQYGSNFLKARRALRKHYSGEKRLTPAQVRGLERAFKSGYFLAVKAAHDACGRTLGVVGTVTTLAHGSAAVASGFSVASGGALLPVNAVGMVRSGRKFVHAAQRKTALSKLAHIPSGRQSLADVHAYALTKAGRYTARAGLQTAAGVISTAGGVAALVGTAATAVGATALLMATPVGWALGGAGVVIVLSLGAYRLGRHIYKKKRKKRHGRLEHKSITMAKRLLIEGQANDKDIRKWVDAFLRVYNLDPDDLYDDDRSIFEGAVELLAKKMVVDWI